MDILYSSLAEFGNISASQNWVNSFAGNIKGKLNIKCTRLCIQVLPVGPLPKIIMTTNNQNGTVVVSILKLNFLVLLSI